MEIIIFIILGICVFIFSVYFTRWVFKIGKIIQNQKEQTILLKNITENMNKLVNSKVEKQNNLKTISTEKKNNNFIDQYKARQQTSKIMGNYNCPACQNPVPKSDKECPNCGLVINE